MTINADISNELALIKERSGLKEGPNSTIMPTAAPGTADQTELYILAQKKQ